MGGLLSTTVRANGQLGRYWSTAETDLLFSSVGLLLPMEGSNGGTTFVDQSSSPKTVTRNGSGALTNSAGTLPYGLTAYGQTTNSDNLTVSSNAAFGFGTGDWTIEGWVRASNTTSRVNSFVDTRTGSNTGVQCWFGGGASGTPAGSLGFSSNSSVITNSSGSILTADTWYYVRYQRINNLLYAYLGTAGGTASGVINGAGDSRTYASASTCVICADYVQTSSQTFIGQMKDVRITKGVGRATGSFAVPTRSLPTK